MHVGEQFVVVSKPPGIPVVPCVCNILESCLTCTAQVCPHKRGGDHAILLQALSSYTAVKATCSLNHCIRLIEALDGPLILLDSRSAQMCPYDSCRL